MNWIKVSRVLGLIAVLSYMIVILGFWIISSFMGYERFSIQEPVLIIKYTEWALGTLGVIVLISVLKKEALELITEKTLSLK